MRHHFYLATFVIIFTTGAYAYAASENDFSSDKSSSKSLPSAVTKRYEQKASKNVKAVFIDDSSNASENAVLIDTRDTATFLLGKPVYNMRKERVGTLKDIITDADGKAVLAIIADGEFPGYNGKLVAFDYDVIITRDKNGDPIAPITEEIINRAREFAYDSNEPSGGKALVIPPKGFSVSRLLDGQMLDEQGASMAEIDDISFKNGSADMIIIGFDKILGLGGKNAAFPFDEAKLVRKDDKLDFEMTAAQAAQFKAYKKSLSN